MGLMGIGEFARLSRLSPKALRPVRRAGWDCCRLPASTWTLATAARRELASYLVDRLNGKRPVMYEVAARDIPARSLLTLLRYVRAR